MNQGRSPRPDLPDPTDQELDAYIRTRLALIGIDLSVLPDEDSDAPADRAGVHRSLRNFLRNTVPNLSAYELDPQHWPPVLYPASLPPVSESDDAGRSRGQ